jgi:hypothetical protein
LSAARLKSWPTGSPVAALPALVKAEGRRMKAEKERDGWLFAFAVGYTAAWLAYALYAVNLLKR